MQNKLHFRGIWFLPQNKDQQISGTLDYDPEKGLDLQLLGVLTEKDDFSVVTPIICGITADSRKITLYKCHPYKRAFSSKGLETSKFEPEYLFIGLWIPEEEMVFTSIAIRFEDFDRWIQIYGFKKNEYKKETKESFIEYQQPQDISYPILDNAQCDFKFSTYAPYSKFHSSITIEQVCETVLYYKDEKKKFESLFQLFQTFQVFLTLSYFGQPTVHSITLQKEINSEAHGPHHKNIKLFFTAPFAAAAYKKRQSNRHFLFTYKEIQHNLADILKKWFEAESTLAPTIYGLAEAFSKKDTLMEFAFLNIAHAIESFHRRRRKNYLLTSTEYKNKLTEIINGVPIEYKDWVHSKLMYGNEPFLHERLTELIHELPENIRKVLLKPSEEDFIKDFKRSRNYYTHYDESLEKKALKGREFYYLIERSKIFLICIVLKEIGFKDVDLANIIFNKGVILFNQIIDYNEVEGYM